MAALECLCEPDVLEQTMPGQLPKATLTSKSGLN
jgi:hypothetical protein